MPSLPDLVQFAEKVAKPKDGKSFLPHELGRRSRHVAERVGVTEVQEDAHRAHGALAVDLREDVFGVDVDASAQDRVGQNVHLRCWEMGVNSVVSFVVPEVGVGVFDQQSVSPPRSVHGCGPGVLHGGLNE